MLHLDSPLLPQIRTLIIWLIRNDSNIQEAKASFLMMKLMIKCHHTNACLQKYNSENRFMILGLDSFHGYILDVVCKVAGSRETGVEHCISLWYSLSHKWSWATW